MHRTNVTMKTNAYEGVIFITINVLCPFIFQILSFRHPEIFHGFGQGIAVMGAVTLVNLYRLYVNPKFRLWYGFVIIANTASFMLFGMVSFFLALYYVLPLLMR